MLFAGVHVCTFQQEILSAGAVKGLNFLATARGRTIVTAIHSLLSNPLPQQLGKRNLRLSVWSQFSLAVAPAALHAVHVAGN